MSESGWYNVDGKPVHIYGSKISPETLEQVRAIIAEIERAEREGDTPDFLS